MTPAADRAMDGDGYTGPARLQFGTSILDVQADLRGQFEPIDGRYHWYGRLARHDDLTAAMTGQGRATAVLSTPDGSADCEISDADPWQRYRVSGISTPPFRSELACPADAAGERSAEAAGGVSAERPADPGPREQ
jgi:Domain of unknown function (DUF4873)